jgi:hypothetical protein
MARHPGRRRSLASVLDASAIQARNVAANVPPHGTGYARAAYKISAYTILIIFTSGGDYRSP